PRHPQPAPPPHRPTNQGSPPESPPQCSGPKHVRVVPFLHPFSSRIPSSRRRISYSVLSTRYSTIPVPDCDCRQSDTPNSEFTCSPGYNTPMRYSLRTLLIVLALGPMAIALMAWACLSIVHDISPRELTLSTIIETTVRIHMYMLAHRELPGDLSVLP